MNFLFFHLLFNNLIVFYLVKFVGCFRLLFLCLSNKIIKLVLESDVPLFFKLFLISNYFQSNSVLINFLIIFEEFLLKPSFKGLLFLFQCCDFTLKVLILFNDGILKVCKFNVISGELLMLWIHVTFHILILLGGLYNVFYEWLFSPIDDSP